MEAVEPLGQDDPAVRVRLRTPGQAELVSSVTRESVDLLGLRAGLEVLLLCKATAVRIGRGDCGEACEGDKSKRQSHGYGLHAGHGDRFGLVPAFRLW